jgi:25S rRNA (adenine2142-N1)-methyltransferase
MAARKPFSQRGSQRGRLKGAKGAQIVGNYHTLLKSRAKAEKAGDTALVDAINSQLETIGLARYQSVSLRGQSSARGGDSSKILVKWCKELGLQQLDVLEIGSLQVDNEISKAKCTRSIERIDLQPVSAGIKKEDFMERPFGAKFDLISMSLVLNFTSLPEMRGEMLKRVGGFLSKNGHLFIVLPSQCVCNSRYLTLDHLNNIMDALGYRIKLHTMTSKIGYWLFEYTGEEKASQGIGHKKVISEGKSRNNFAILA